MAATNDHRSIRLKKHWFEILLALADGAQHGYAIRSRVEDGAGGRVKLYPATLYGSIREMADTGLIEAMEGADGPDDDQRRRYFGLTKPGREVLRAEVERLQGVVDAALATEALGGA
jgi:DNA-binding PadR family transcriptional regulator